MEDVVEEAIVELIKMRIRGVYHENDGIDQSIWNEEDKETLAFCEKLLDIFG